jgi:hypothetical protein
MIGDEIGDELGDELDAIAKGLDIGPRAQTRIDLL